MFIDIDSALKNFDKYFQYYKLFKNNSSDLLESIDFSSVYFSNDKLNLEYLPSVGKKDRIFLIIPSIINSSSIFKIGDKTSFINFLKNFGDVFLIHWNDPNVNDSKFNLSDYSIEASKILSLLNNKFQQKIDLIGYCLGGNFAISASILYQDKVNSLMLIATPWDFEYLKKFRLLQKFLNLESTISDEQIIPIVYMQIIFFLMDIEKSFNKFFYESYLDHYDFKTYLEVENWLYNGNNITKSSYEQLMHEFIDANITMNNLWYLGDKCINPTEIQIPVLSILGLRDKVVAAESVRAIYSKLAYCKYIEIDSGHVGFFVGKHKSNLYTNIENWLGENK